MASISGWRVTRAGIIFISIVVLLGLLAFAGIYFAQQRGEQARRDDAAEIARQNLEEQSNQPVVIAEDEGASGAVDDNGDSAPTDEASAEETASPEALPETGADITGLIAVIALSIAAAYFVVSQRAVRQL